MRRYFPDNSAFAAAVSAGGRIIPVYRQLLADRLTPVSAFQLLGRDSHAFLLESVVGGEKIARHSFIATAPSLVYTAMQGQAEIQHFSCSGKNQQFQTADPLADLQKLMPPGQYHHDRTLPAFTGGLVGYAGYDTVRYYEPEKLNHPPIDDRHLPDLQFALYGEIVIFDHVDKTIKVVANAILDEHPDEAAAYADACRRVDALVERLQQPPQLSLGEIDTSESSAVDREPSAVPPSQPSPEVPGEGVARPTAKGQRPTANDTESNMTRDQFESAVERGKEYIRAGDIFQFVPSRRLRIKSAADPFDVYRALRIINPSPFMFYLKSPDCTLIGSSPEILCRVIDGVITSRPLAGTRRRGKTEAEDKALEAELLADPKERAEHVMLVDLHRNDIGRVAKVGTVKLSEMMSVERYSHVMHITTDVQGELAEGKTALDALRVSLPVGTVSGAPKIRAMQIIDELEKTRRGPYGGAVGYLDYSGNMDTCIALRTIVWKENNYDIQVGAGIVADTVPATEYEETTSKARALLKAVRIAQQGF
jgi:anthranilate synthase component 1